MQKQKPYRNKKILEFARGQECQLRLPGICNHNPEATVACHIRTHEFGAGMGVKPDDCAIFYACSSCHDQVDKRKKRIFDQDWLDGQIHIANTRTLRLVIREGILK